MSAQHALQLVKISLEIGKCLVSLGKEAYELRKRYKAAKSKKLEQSAAGEEFARAKASLRCVQAEEKKELPEGAMVGKMDLPSLGLFMQGVFVDFELEGLGLSRTKTTEYVGEFVGGEMHGEGSVVYTERDVRYDGSFVNGRREGFGRLTTAKGTTYEGTFAKDNFQAGRITTPNGLVFTGTVSEWLPTEGRIDYLTTNGLVYDGSISGWKWHGNNPNNSPNLKPEITQ